MKNLLFCLLTVLSLPACSQTENKNSKLVLNKTFKTVLGSVCEETNTPQPCAGYTVFLELSFRKDFVLVNEKNENACGVRSENKYKSKYSVKGNIVKVEKLTRYGEPLNIKELMYTKNSLVGKATEVDRVATEYVFEEVKIK